MILRPALLLLLLGSASCESCLSRHEVEEVPVLAYPTCDGAPLPDGEVIAEGVLRSGPYMREAVVERFTVRRRACVYTITVRQEWAQQATDVEVVYDESWRPLRGWKRMVAPFAPDPARTADTRLYELRNEPPTMTEQNPNGRANRELRGAAPIAVVGPGRALITAWIRAEDLEVGEVARGPVLDFRELYEKIDEVALRRDPDRYEETMGRTVRVYTIFGRESVFTDETGLVLGDLAGLRRPEDVDAPMPPPIPSHAPADPARTP